MGSNELSLDYKPNVDITLSTTPEADQPGPTRKLRQFLARLEQERIKIDVFKKELPLCMQLLNNAMEVYRQQLGGGGGEGGGGEKMAVTEEFLPVVKKSCTGDDEGDNSEPLEKANWLASVQLWTQSNNEVDSSPKRWNTGGAFLPFSKEKPVDKAGACSDLALAPVEDHRPSVLETIEERDKCDNISTTPNLENSGGGGGGGGQETGMGSSGGQNQSHRKARRCWSPDLHRRFVNALQVLGGSQVATPKQIRELMKVDGLTNDEVKSHLQKYRLHTRRPLPPTPQHAVASGHPQLVVLGGIWVPPEYATSTTVYSTHPSNPAQFCTMAATPLSRGFYSSPAAPQPPQATNAHSHCSITRHICGLQETVKGNREETSESTEGEIKEEVEAERKSGSSSSNRGGGGGGGSGGEEDSNGSDMC